MKKRISILSLIGVFLVVVATAISSSASMYLFYQPKVPKCPK